MCFQANSKFPHADQFFKSRIFNKAIYSILSIDTFEQQCVLIKCTLQTSRLEDHMTTIGIDQSSFTRSSFEHRCMNNSKKINRNAGKCDYQQNIKDIIDATILSTQEGVTYDSPNVPMTSTPVKKASAIKSLCRFTNILDIKPETKKTLYCGCRIQT